MLSRFIKAHKLPKMVVSKRFEGSAKFYDSFATTDSMTPGKDHNLNRADSYLDESEVITRMLKVLHNFGAYDLKSFDFKKTFE